MINGNHVDREFLNIVDIFKDKPVVLTDDELRIREIEKVYSKFNLQSESLLMNRIKVNYKEIINVICWTLNDNKFTIHDIQKDTIESEFYMISKFQVLTEKYEEKIDFQIHIPHSKIENLGNWFFGASVICNAIANSKKCKADDITFLFDKISVLECDYGKFAKMKSVNLMAEIPQMTLSERTKGLKLNEFKPDDFEVWNYNIK